MQTSTTGTECLNEEIQLSKYREWEWRMEQLTAERDVGEAAIGGVLMDEELLVGAPVESTDAEDIGVAEFGDATDLGIEILELVDGVPEDPRHQQGDGVPGGPEPQVDHVEEGDVEEEEHAGERGQREDLHLVRQVRERV